MTIIQFVSLTSGGEHHVCGQYLAAYNGEVHTDDGGYDGGLLLTTRHPDQAWRFITPAEAIDFWKHAGPSCQCHRTRADGRPNKPLTAFNISVQELRPANIPVRR